MKSPPPIEEKRSIIMQLETRLEASVTTATYINRLLFLITDLVHHKHQHDQRLKQIKKKGKNMKIVFFLPHFFLMIK